MFDATKEKYPDIEFQRVDVTKQKELVAKYYAGMDVRIPMLFFLGNDDEVLFVSEAPKAQKGLEKLIKKADKKRHKRTH